MPAAIAATTKLKGEKKKTPGARAVNFAYIRSFDSLLLKILMIEFLKFKQISPVYILIFFTSFLIFCRILRIQAIVAAILSPSHAPYIDKLF